MKGNVAACLAVLVTMLTWGCTAQDPGDPPLLGATTNGSTTGWPPPTSGDPGTSDGWPDDDDDDDDPDPETTGNCMPGMKGCECGPDEQCDEDLWCMGGLCLECSSCGACGDQSCDANESCETCAADCGSCPGCGDGECATDEKCSTCPEDCDVCVGCGDGECGIGETCNSCEADCGTCDVCSEATSGDGWYCGATLGTGSDTLYLCNGGQTVDSQACAHGCAQCDPGTPDVCRDADETDEEACAECSYYDDPDGCPSTDQWCSTVQLACISCSNGFANCDQTMGCECQGYCDESGECQPHCSQNVEDDCDSALQWCNVDQCQACPSGFVNCDGVDGCECDGYCSPTVSGLCCPDDGPIGPGCNF